MIVRLPKALRKYASDLDFVEVKAATVAEAIAAAVTAHPDLRIRLVDDTGRVRPHLALFLDGEQVLADEVAETPVAAESRLDVLISIVGG